MSSIAVTASATGAGVITLAAPVTNTNRTITLPDVTATVITDSAGVLNIGAGQVYKDASGNVGIGTSSPASKLEVAGAGTQQITVRSQTSGDAVLYLEASGINSGEVGYLRSGQALYFKNGGVERARIDSSGGLYLGTTAGKYNSKFVVVKGSSSYNITSSVTGTNAQGHMVFENADANAVGTIFTSGSGTSYNTSSDYRLKNTIAPMTGALDKLALLKPCTYKWNSDGLNGQGFIAHELAEVEPGCVTGEKDATETRTVETSPAIPAVVDADGVETSPAVAAVTEEQVVPKYQGIDTSFLVATLTAAIQELKAIVDAQGAEIAALKGAPA